MSKVTNPDLEQSVTCGFYNSLGDRRYDATQMSSIFDGVINDGVFASIGDCFVVRAGSGNTVNVGTGKCWFNHTWTQNDAILPVDCEESEQILDRIDAIVIEVNATEAVRDNIIKVVKGKPSSNSPVRPTLINDNGVYQHALCYIRRPAGSTEIVGSNIDNVVGPGMETPFVTGIVEVLDFEELATKWQSDLDEFVGLEKEEFNVWYSEMQTLMQNVIDETNAWTENQKNTIYAWFDEIKGKLSEDVAVGFQIQLDESEVKNILMNGLPDGTKTISADGTSIATVDSAGRRLVKTFSNNFSLCTTILYSAEGGELGILTKEFSSDGKTITSQMNII